MLLRHLCIQYIVYVTQNDLCNLNTFIIPLFITAVSALQSIEAAKRVETEVMQANKTLTKDGVLDQPTSA